MADGYIETQARDEGRLQVVLAEFSNLEHMPARWMVPGSDLPKRSGQVLAFHLLVGTPTVWSPV
jgi:hypothetical protein